MDRVEDFEDVLERMLRWMAANPEACRALEARLDKIETDFGDITVLRTIRPNDPAPEISQFQQVTDELKPKGKARDVSN